MHLTLDQALALEAIARLGTIQEAARHLHKGHSAVLYLIRTLEEQVGLPLFDRGAYRNQLNPHGEIVLKYCQDLITTKKELESICNRLKGGWEAKIHVIYDGVIDFNILAEAVKRLNQEETIPVDIKIGVAYLNEVERAFIQEKAALMVTVVPIHLPEIESIPLPPIEMHLVAHKNHPLNKTNKRLHAKDLEQHPFIQVRETTNILGLSTEKIGLRSSITVNDFPTKHKAISKGLGFGWLPGYLVEKQLEMGKLRVLKTECGSHHKLYPRLYHYRKELMGRGTELFIQQFSNKTSL